MITSTVLAAVIAVLAWQMGALWTENETLRRELGECKAEAMEEAEDLGRDVLNCRMRASNLVATLQEVREELAERKAELEQARDQERMNAYDKGVREEDVDALTALLERDGWSVEYDVDGRKVVETAKREEEIVRTGEEIVAALRMVAADAVGANLGVGGGDSVLHVVASACPQLSALRLMGLDATDAGFIALGKGCPLLADVSVYPWMAPQSQISNIGLAALASPLLTSLAIPGAAVDDDGLADLARSAPNLSTLRVGGEHAGVTDAGIVSYLAASPQLVELDLSSSHVGDAPLLALAEGKCSLTTLNLYYAKNVTDTGVSALASCEALTSLSLTGTRVTDVGVASLAAGAADIHVLDLGMTKVTDEGLAGAIEAMPSLTSLDVHWTKVGDATMAALAAHTSLSKLLASHSDSISDAGLEALAGMSTLTEVHLGGGVTDKGVSALAKGNSGLTLVDLTWASDVGDGAVAALVEHCPDLSVLRLDGTAVTDASLVALGSGGTPNLTQLKLSDTSVTDLGLIALANSCPPSLSYLSLGNTGVGDDGVAALALCPSLDTLWLVKTKVGDRGAEALAALCPGLKDVWFDWSSVGNGAAAGLREACVGARVSN